MIMETLASKKRVARKDHHCNACEWITMDGDYRQHDFTFSEWRAIARAKENGWKILKGETYNWASCKQDGELYQWKAIPEMEAICHKYDYFADYY
jgi:hypothetical protein